MASPSSPSKISIFNGLDENVYSDAKFAQEIDRKMHVPKRIKATGESSNEDTLLSNQNGYINSWNYHDKIDMNVPDRIVVLGHNQHLETRSAPREIQLENSILPKSPPSFVRVQTPPRVITLNEHPFPSASEENSPIRNRNDEDLISKYAESGANFNGLALEFAGNSESESQATTGTVSRHSHQQMNNSDLQLIGQQHGNTTILGDVAPSVEIRYLRGQIARLNQRVQNIEISNEQYLQREKILWGLGVAYLVLKTLVWLSR